MKPTKGYKCELKSTRVCGGFHHSWCNGADDKHLLRLPERGRGEAHVCGVLSLMRWDVTMFRAWLILNKCTTVFADHPQIKSQARGIVTAERDQLEAVSRHFSCAKKDATFPRRLSSWCSFSSYSFAKFPGCQWIFAWFVYVSWTCNLASSTTLLLQARCPHNRDFVVCDFLQHCQDLD